jgi:hypothetical protein
MHKKYRLVKEIMSLKNICQQSWSYFDDSLSANKATTLRRCNPPWLHLISRVGGINLTSTGWHFEAKKSGGINNMTEPHLRWWVCNPSYLSIIASLFNPLAEVSGKDSTYFFSIFFHHPGLPGVLHHSDKLQTSTPGYIAVRACWEELVGLHWHDDVAYTIV